MLLKVSELAKVSMREREIFDQLKLAKWNKVESSSSIRVSMSQIFALTIFNSIKPPLYYTHTHTIDMYIHMKLFAT